MAVKLNRAEVEFNLGYWLREVQISTLQGAQKPVLSSPFQISHAENTQIHRKTLQEDRHR